MRNLLGGKGAGLAEMAHLGLPVPPGFTITTEVCTYFYEHGKTYPKDLKAAGRSRARRGRPHHRKEIRRRQKSAAGFGALRRARLDAGHDGHRAQSRAQRRDGRGACGKIRRPAFRARTATGASSPCIPTWCSASRTIISRKSSTTTRTATAIRSTPISHADDWEEIVERYKERVEEESGKPFPQDPHAQLWGAIGAVFGSWMNQRAITYRRLHAIPESWGTAVNVQAMVFGNMGETSATGVAFTRNPSTGEKKLYGEFLINAQGEDVVAGIRTPQEITEAARKEAGSDKPSMEAALPDAFAELKRIHDKLERHYRDMQDLEFTVEQGKLWMLQTRSGKRTAQAALRIAVELAQEKLITKEEAVARVDPAVARSASASDHRSEGRAQGASPPACRLRPARPAARSCFRPKRPSCSRARAAKSSWCASKPRRRTSTACTPPKEF